MATLNKYKENIHSQNGEDGIIREINKRLGITKGWFVEFGAWDGKHLSNCFNLAEQDWNGVYIESEKERFKDLLKNMKSKPLIMPINSSVESSGESSLDNLLSKTPIPKDFDLLSIDIDSYDYWVWKYLFNYNPKVVIIEVNSFFKVGKKRVNPNNKCNLNFGGTSFTSMLQLGLEKGYTLVCHTGNMIFVRNDLIDKLDLSKEELENPNSLYLRLDFNWKEKIVFNIKYMIDELIGRKFLNG